MCMSVINVNVDLFNIELIENMRKILHLNLKKKWFDMIVSGEKKGRVPGDHRILGTTITFGHERK